VQASDLRKAQPSLNAEQKERVVATTAPGALVWGPEECCDLGTGQESDQPPGLTLVGNRKDLLHPCRLRWLLIGGKPEEGTDGGQA